MHNIINASIQIIPKCDSDKFYSAIDAAIKVIQQSGLKHLVTPMETVVEGYYDEIIEVFKRAQQASFDIGANDLVVSIRFHIKKYNDVRFEEKTESYN